MLTKKLSVKVRSVADDGEIKLTISIVTCS